MNEVKQDSIILKYAKKYYPEDIKDWSARHRALAMVAEIIRDINQFKKRK